MELHHSIMHEQLTINEDVPVIARYFEYERFTYPWHLHSEYEIIYVREGVGDRFVADSMEGFAAGDLILLGSNVPHYMRSAAPYYSGDGTLRAKGVVIQFAQDFMSHAINHYTDLRHIKLLLEKAQRGIHFPLPQNSSLVNLVDALPAYAGLNRLIQLLVLLDQMATFDAKRALGSVHFEAKPSLFADNRIERVLSYIHYHYTQPLPLCDMAAILSMQTSAFCRFFKEKTGKTFTAYVLELRIGYACKLLMGTSHDVAQISIECGFNTLCHFNKLFKQTTGHTPSGYRKYLLGKYV